jgi:hypothetical protein
MNTRTRLRRIPEARQRKVCTSPTLGELLSDFFVELLEDSAAKEVEDHLLRCLYCRNRYFKMLKVMNTAPPADVLPGIEDGPVLNDALAPDGARVLSINEFKKRRP